MENLVAILAVIGLAGVGVLGDYFIKLAGDGNKYIYYHWFFAGMITYAITAIGWFFVMKHIKLSTLGVLYSLTSVILLVLVGAFVFKEHLNAYDVVGIILGIASILILSRVG